MATQILLLIRYANLLPARQDGAIILPANHYMNHHLPADISYQLADLYELVGFKPPTIFFNILAKLLKYCGMFRNKCNIISFH